MANSTTFWRRIGFVGACFILGSLCWSVFSSVGGPARSGSSRGELDDSEFVDVTIPKSHFSPAEVVALQVQALRDSVTEPEKMKICYSFASPKNREVTGPYARFAEMVMTPPYDKLAVSQDWQVGNAAIEKDYAAVLVSTLSANGDATAFRFLLHQYKRAPYQGCWLTEAVMVMEQVGSAEESGVTPTGYKE
jgi:hypothetical protein